jgi:hypothetical protein
MSVAEFLGTAWLVLGGCGSAVLAAAFPQLGIGFVGVSFAFGLTVLTMAYAIGHVSGCHLNPAVSVGLWAGGRFKAAELPGYIIAQVLGSGGGAFMLSIVDPMGPTPGIDANRRLTSSSRCHFISLVSISLSRASTAAYFWAWKAKSSRAVLGRASSSNTS